MASDRPFAHEQTLPADLVAFLLKGEQARQQAHEVAEQAFAVLLAFALKQAGIPEGAPFEITPQEDGTAVVRFGEVESPAVKLVTLDEGAE